MVIDLDKYDRLITYGCSWTAGCEINDHKIFGKTFHEMQYEKLHCKDIEEFHNKKTENGDTYWSVIKKNEDLNRNRAWGYHLAQKLSLKFLNRAKGGSGIDFSLFSMIFDTQNGTIKNTDLIIVGLTTPTRLFLWNDNHKIENRILGVNLDKKIDKLMHYLWSDNNLIFSYLNTLSSILMFQNTLVFFVRHNPFEGKFAKDYKINTHNMFLYKKVLEKYKDRFFDRNILLEQGFHEHCGFGHPQEKEHIILAEKLYQQINKN